MKLGNARSPSNNYYENHRGFQDSSELKMAEVRMSYFPYVSMGLLTICQNAPLSTLYKLANNCPPATLSYKGIVTVPIFIERLYPVPKVQCMNPKMCRVKFHRDTTDAKCRNPQASQASTQKLMGAPLTQSDGKNPQIAILEAAVEARGKAPEFQALLQRREELKILVPEYYEAINAGKTGDQFELTRLKRELKELSIQKTVNRHEIEMYKDETAQKYVHPLNELTTDRIAVFEGDTIGNCVRTVSAPTGSRAWLEQRQNGVGGSDVGSIIGTGGDYAEDNYNRVWWSKVEPITDEEVEEQTQGNVGGAIGRGHTWEQRILERFAVENDNLEVILAKDSYRHKDNAAQVINVDGLLSDTGDGVPNGIFEAKTSSRPEDWATGVPDGYKAQVLHYLNQTGFKYAYVGVMIDDNEYRQYRINANDSVTTNSGTKPFNEYLPEIEEFWQSTQDYKNNPPAPEPEVTKRKTPQKSKFRNVTDTAIDNLSAYRDEDPQITHDLIRQGISNGMSAHDSIANLYNTFDPSQRRRNFAYVDLETTGLSDSTAEIIEFGVTIRNHRNEVVEEFESRYSPDPRILDLTGTGMVEVHGIGIEDVRGKPMFTEPENMKRIMSLMEDTVMVAHNKSFEQRFLNANLDGFQEAEIPALCTMHLSRYMVPDSDGNSLENFAEHHGIPYVNAHSALPDAQMDAAALFAWEQTKSQAA